MNHILLEKSCSVSQGDKKSKCNRTPDEIEAFQMVLFDFVVIDDQTFTFHMQEEDTSTPNLSLLHTFVQKISRLKNL